MSRPRADRGDGTPEPPFARPPAGAGARPGRALAVAAAVAGAALAAAGCDDQLKRVEAFSFMTDGPAIETYEQQPRPLPEGAVPVDGRRSYTLSEADTALRNPLDATTENIRRGREAFADFCAPCHGSGGRGDGPVINDTGEHPRRMPALPTANLLSDRARGLTDGYIYGMITNGRGIYMPSYRRIPRHRRWQIVTYVRHLQRTASDAPGASGGTGAEPGAAGRGSSPPAAGDGG